MIQPNRPATLLAGASAVLIALLALTTAASAASHRGVGGGAPRPSARAMMSSGLILPEMNAARGRRLFANKGCVVCHSINGVGGEDARPLDASTMELPMNPFEFAARMWRGAEPMIALQREELGGQIELSGEELADLIAFVHDPVEQRKFSAGEIPHQIKDAMTKAHGPGAQHGR